MTLKGVITRVRYIFQYRSVDLNLVETYRKNGVTIGENVQLLNTKLDYNHGFLIEIGNNVTITNAVILTHDASTHIFTGYSKIGGVIIGDNVFIGYGSIVLPGVRIGNDCIVGAGSIVTKDVPEGTVVAGNPARAICKTSDYIDRHKKAMKCKPVYHKAWELSPQEKIKARKEVCLNHGGYDL